VLAVVLAMFVRCSASSQLPTRQATKPLQQQTGLQLLSAKLANGRLPSRGGASKLASPTTQSTLTRRFLAPFQKKTQTKARLAAPIRLTPSH